MKYLVGFHGRNLLYHALFSMKIGPQLAGKAHREQLVCHNRPSGLGNMQMPR